MVASANMGWLSEMSSRVGDNLKHSRSLSMESKTPNHLGILGFETGKIMSRLVSLYKSLSDYEVLKLRNEIMKSEGVAYLNSKDEGFLLSLACAERLEDLDKIAAAVARFGQKCKDFGLSKFDHVYTDLKLGIIDFERLDYGSKETEKKVEKMEKLLAATSNLYNSWEALSELELSEKKLKEWKRKASSQLQRPNIDLFNQKIEHQRKQVRHFRENSLCSKTFDKSVGLMARIVCIVYARICSVFGPYVPILPLFTFRSLPELSKIEPKKASLVHFYSTKTVFQKYKHSGGVFKGEVISQNNMVFHAADGSTVGGSGLSLRYANVILLVERYLRSSSSLDHQGRDSLYHMLPENMKVAVKTKLSKNMKCVNGEDDLLAEGWREAMIGILRWLLPMAHSTVKWQMERNVEKTMFDPKPSVLLLQTLHFADKEKTEAAIAEVLVCLSCIYRYENRQ